MELTDFLHAGVNSGKLKFVSLIFERVWSKMSVVIDLVQKTLKYASCILRMNASVELIFCMLTVMQ